MRKQLAVAVMVLAGQAWGQSNTWSNDRYSVTAYFDESYAVTFIGNFIEFDYPAFAVSNEGSDHQAACSVAVRLHAPARLRHLGRAVVVRDRHGCRCLRRSARCGAAPLPTALHLRRRRGNLCRPPRARAARPITGARTWLPGPNVVVDFDASASEAPSVRSSTTRTSKARTNASRTLVFLLSEQRDHRIAHLHAECELCSGTQSDAPAARRDRPVRAAAPPRSRDPRAPRDLMQHRPGALTSS